MEDRYPAPSPTSPPRSARSAPLNTLLDHVEFRRSSARQRSEQQVRQFVADASHGLRTPLTTVAGTPLAGPFDDRTRRRTTMAKVSEESLRMSSLVDDLLLLARLDSGRPLAGEPVDLTRLLIAAVDDARVVDPDHLGTCRSREPVVVTGDERAAPGVTNLLTNAR